MTQLIYFFIIAMALCIGSPMLHADDTEMGDMGQKVDAAQNEVQGTVQEEQQEAADEVDAADDVEDAEDMGTGQEGPEDAVQPTQAAPDNTAGDSAY